MSVFWNWALKSAFIYSLYDLILSLCCCCAFGLYHDWALNFYVHETYHSLFIFLYYFFAYSRHFYFCLSNCYNKYYLSFDFSWSRCILGLKILWLCFWPLLSASLDFQVSIQLWITHHYWWYWHRSCFPESFCCPNSFFEHLQLHFVYSCWPTM